MNESVITQNMSQKLMITNTLGGNLHPNFNLNLEYELGLWDYILDPPSVTQYGRGFQHQINMFYIIYLSSHVATPNPTNT